MIFNSSAFVLFALIFFSIYIFLKGRWRICFLLLASYIFYGWWDWRYLGLIFLTTGVDFWAGLKMAGSPTQVVRRRYLLLSVGLNLFVLSVFKYFNFFSDSLAAILGSVGIASSPWWIDVLLPVGISFYTFQSMAYTIDVYRRVIPAERNLIDFAAFVAFFPQLVAGPIERAGRLLPQLKALPGGATLSQIKEGVGLIIWGYFLKVCIADNLARVVDIYFNYGRDQSEDALTISGAPNHFFLNDPQFDAILRSTNLHLTSPEILMCMLAFGMQIYGDFAGYTNIARGLAKFFGIELMVNFRQPYFAQNPSDFWKRWHISLSSWFKEYLYISLGGNRHGFLLRARNLMIVMLIAGLWHGAAWHYVLWGAYWGLLLVGYHGIRVLVPSTSQNNIFLRLRSIVIMFGLTMLGWLIFRSSGLSQLKYFVEKLLTNIQWVPAPVATTFQINLFWVLAFTTIILSVDAYLERTKKECILTFQHAWQYLLALLLLWLIVVYGGQSEQFIYFRF